MDKKEQLQTLYRYLKKEYPDAHTFLDYTTPFHLLIAVILSAQTTDAQVNRVTPALFARYRTPSELAAADRGTVESLVFSTGFYRMKTRNIIAAAQTVASVFGGTVPEEMHDLLKIPGVGRKSANVVRAHCFAKPAIIVDTHFSRVVQRLGLTEESAPRKIEKEIARIADPGIWTDLSMVINVHGRKRCFAKKPDCEGCSVRLLCPFYGPFYESSPGFVSGDN